MERLQDKDLQVVSVIKYLFREYCANEDLSTEQMPDVAPGAFVKWVTGKGMVTDYHFTTELAERGISEEAQELVQEIFKDEFRAYTVMVRLWPAIVLSGRPPVKHQPFEIEMNITVRYHDGRYAKIGTIMPNPEGDLTDGLAGCNVRAGVMEVLKTFYREGLDKLYSESRPTPVNKPNIDPT